jgi:hypothetical protein
VFIHVDFVNYQLHGTAREFVAMTVAYAITNAAEVSVNMMIQHSAEKPTLTKSVYCDCLVCVTIVDTFPAISFGLF